MPPPNNNVTAPADDSDPDDSDRWEDGSELFSGQPVADELDLASLTGQTLEDNYRIAEPIGSGGFSWVFRATQLSTGQEVAVKVPRSAGEAAERLRRGGRLLGKLDHPCIANLIDAGEFSIGEVRLPFVVMQLVRNARLLGTFCQEEDLDRPSRLELFATICEAVDSAHAIGVIHRDLKPGNILVDDRGQPKVIDFDISRIPPGLLTTVTESGAPTEGVIGTLLYMAPEQLQGKAVTPQSDVFTLGVILQEIMTGHPPKRPAAFAPIAAGAAEPLPAGVSRVVKRCLAEEPTGRYERAAEVADAIRECLENRGYIDPWWRSASRVVAAAARQSAAGVMATARSKTAHRFAAVSAVAVAVAWMPVSRWREEQAKAADYRAAVSAAVGAVADAASDPARSRELVATAANSWRAWQPTELPLEIVCLQNLLADPASRSLGGTRLATLAASGRWLATATAEGNVRLADTAEPATPVARRPGLPQAEGVVALAMGPRNRLAAGTAGGWRLWNLDQVGASSRPLAGSDSGDGGIAGFDFSADGGRLAVVLAAGEIEVWNLPAAGEPSCITTIPAVAASSAPPPSACLSRDGMRLFVTADGGRLRVVEAATAIEVAAFEGLTPGRPRLVRSADGTRLVSFVPGGRLRWHDPNTGRPLAQSATDPAGCLLAAFTPDGGRLMVVRQRGSEGSLDQVIDIHDAATAVESRRLASIPVPRPIGEIAIGGDSRLALELDGAWQFWGPDPPQAAEPHELATRSQPAAGALAPPLD
jgi:hypothetical protein